MVVTGVHHQLERGQFAVAKDLDTLLLVVQQSALRWIVHDELAGRAVVNVEKLGGQWLRAVVYDVIVAGVVLSEEPAAIVDA